MIIIFEEIYELLKNKEFKIDSLNKYDRDKIELVNETFNNYNLDTQMATTRYKDNGRSEFNIWSDGKYIIIPFKYSDMVLNHNINIYNKIFRLIVDNKIRLLNNLNPIEVLMLITRKLLMNKNI